MRGSIALGLALALASGGAQAAAPSQFDLICHGRVTDLGSGRSFDFDEHYRVDLPTQRFCWGRCSWPVQLTQVRGARLDYRYRINPGGPMPGDYRPDADPPGQDGEIIVAAGGPSPVRDDLTIDAATGRLSRTFDYDEGEPGAHRFRTRSSGRCTMAPFSGFQQRTALPVAP